MLSPAVMRLHVAIEKLKAVFDARYPEEVQRGRPAARVDAAPNG